METGGDGQPPDALPTALSRPAETPPHSLQERYRIERELGRGGMGRVFAAVDLQLGRRVAIKMLAPGPHVEDELLRFRQEARAAGSLNHPNVLTVFDLGASEVGPYIVSELLEGRTLRAALGESPLPLAEAIEWARQLAEGLAAAHGKGIVHRDLKPEISFSPATGASRSSTGTTATWARCASRRTSDPADPHPYQGLRRERGHFVQNAGFVAWVSDPPGRVGAWLKCM